MLKRSFWELVFHRGPQVDMDSSSGSPEPDGVIATENSLAEEHSSPSVPIDAGSTSLAIDEPAFHSEKVRFGAAPRVPVFVSLGAVAPTPHRFLRDQEGDYSDVSQQ